MEYWNQKTWVKHKIQNINLPRLHSDVQLESGVYRSKDGDIRDRGKVISVRATAPPTVTTVILVVVI